uniref:Uncharacterized protein n=1 Tax=Solanum tuberosum TaxID=4113 RepID=M1AQ93_SOLTU
MANQSSKKAKAKKDVPASSKAKVEKQQQKRGRKVSPAISRSTLSRVCIEPCILVFIYFVLNLCLPLLNY